MFQLLQTEDEDARLELPSNEPEARGHEDWPAEEEVAFKLDRVTFSYKPGVVILHDVSIEAAVGDDGDVTDVSVIE